MHVDPIERSIKSWNLQRRRMAFRIVQLLSLFQLALLCGGCVSHETILRKLDDHEALLLAEAERSLADLQDEDVAANATDGHPTDESLLFCLTSIDLHSGLHDKVGRFDITIATPLAADDRSREPPSEVYILGVSAEDAGRWVNADSKSRIQLAQSSGFAWRASLNTDQSELHLLASDPIWARWNHARPAFLVIFVEPPAHAASSANPNRIRWVRVLPLRMSRWNVSKIKLEVGDRGLLLLTPPLPPEPRI